jgi:hypothetical protein
MQCEVHVDCHEPVVAKVGLLGRDAKWACQEGFQEFEGNPRCGSTVGSGGLQCALRQGHEGRHASGTTRWGD